MIFDSMRIWGKKHKKLFSSVLFLGIFLFSTMVSLVFPETSYAILGAGDTSIDVTPPGTPNQQQLFHVQEKVKLSTDKAITASVLSSAVQGASYFMRRLAYDTAVYVASGGKGQGSLLFSSNWDQYLGQVGGDALGRAVQELGSVWGLDFCKFPNLDLQLYLQIGLRQMEAPTTECSWNDLVRAYGDKDFWNKGFWERQYDKLEALQNRFDSSDEVIKEFSKAIKVKNSDFGIALGAIGQVDKIKVKSEDAKTAERLEGAGFKPLTDALSGRVKTPGDAIGQETKAQLSASKQQELTYGQLGSIYASGAIEIIPQTASLFLNTLTNQLLQRLLTQGLVSGDSDPESVYYSDFDPGYRNNVENARAAFNFLFTRTPTQLTDYNIIGEFAACPDSPGLNNCVMDSGLQDALARAGVDEPLTIREAMEEGYLNENWQLISPRNERLHQDIKGCVVGRYCYSNIQKLRKARILPLGFEIAALRSDPDNPWTLGDVVRGFDDCRRDPDNPQVVIPDASKPFCHLINPNWVIKPPVARCDAPIISQVLSDPESTNRQASCVDISTCLMKDENGACIDYGYCTKEKNVWKIGADVCPDYYNTCTTYTNVDSKKVVSYLSKTLDYGQCTADDVGCRAYSLENLFAPEGQAAAWKNSASVDVAQKASGRNQVVFFNEKIEDLSSVCSTNSDGCTAFYTADRASDGRYVDRVTTTPALEFQVNKQIEPAYIRKAPDYMGCYDTNLALLGNQWPLTIQEAQNSVSQNPACNNFAAACVAEEVGCEAFTPLKRTNLNETDGPSIPGKIGAANICASECLGYETFKQEESPFESAEFPVHFIPSQAKSCPAIAAGCSEFTNIDVQARGGEGLEYYTDLKYCEKPAGDNMKTFYSWEGSADNGYVLQTYRLKQLSESEAQDIARPGFEQGSPAYILDMPEFLDEYVAKCNEQAYNALLQNRGDNTEDLDCKAFFDDEGTTYYRLLSKTVSISPECHPLRKTEPEFVVDTHLATEQICVAKKGVWSDGECQRCKNGGKFENGFCVYNVITSEAQSCAAEYNGCRAYSGNAVGNIEQIFFDDFEPAGENPDAFVQAANGWKSGANNDAPLRIVGEATHTGLHSIEVTPGTIPHRAIPDGTISENSWYEVSFLAKSGQQNTSLLVQLKQYLNGGDQVVGEFTTNNDPLVIGNSWQVYRLGPVQFTGTPSSTFLTFSRTNGNNNYYIDQVQFKKLTDYAHYVKDSWKAANNGLNVPLACDSAPLDDLPGEALGCRAYADSNNNVRFATGFERLCREDAIGCAPVWDTYNTIAGDGSDRAQVFNLECQSAANTTCLVVFQEQELGSCFVEPGATSCSVEKIVLPEEAPTVEALRNAGNSIQMTASSVFVSADTPDNAPIFLAVGEKNEFACSPGQKGCQSVGLEEKRLPTSDAAAFSYTELFVKNDPDSYLDTLCRDDLVGCAKFKADNQETYFKDPQITGNSLCVYKPQASNQSGPYGWFLKDIGRCSNDQNELCRADSDCGEGATCTEKETVACAEDNLRAGGFYDIWSNSTPERYQGNVGVCTPEYNGCREIVDRQDTSNLHPEGKPYYVIFNQKMEQKAKECTQASLTEGCVLFDKTDEPNKIFDSAETYLRSQNRADQPFGFVDPVRPENPADADTNLLLKVDRDRECSEWLACKSYAANVSYIDGQRKETHICHQLAACDEIGPGNVCLNWVDPVNDSPILAQSRLKYENYVTRPVSWFSEEYSGYSLYNRFQIGDLVHLKFEFPDHLKPLLQNESNSTYIVRQMRQALFADPEVQDLDCRGATPQENTDWQICGFGDGQGPGGRCYAKQCLYPVNGVFPIELEVGNLNSRDPIEIARNISTIKKLVNFLEPNSCKSVPELDSPFSDKVLKITTEEQNLVNEGVAGLRRDTTQKIGGFTNANVCQFGDCSCTYQKVRYNNGATDYWPLYGLPRGVTIPKGICLSGGDKEGYPCEENIDCVDNRGTPSTEDDEFGTCSRRERIETQIGLEGYCLEYDYSRPILYNGENSYACLTWLPVNVSASAVDIYNTDVSAGYDPIEDATDGGGEVFCAESTLTGAGVIDDDFDILDGENVRNYYNRYFLPDGSPRLNTTVSYRNQFNEEITLDILYDNWTCGSPAISKDHDNNNETDPLNSVIPAYRALICAGRNIDGNGQVQETVGKPLYSMVRSWLQEQGLYNSTVLRVEWGAAKGFDNWGLDWDDGEDPKTGVRRVYSLAPLNAGIQNEEDIRELGTIMHPPRVFNGVALGEDDFGAYVKQGTIINPPENQNGAYHNAKVFANAYGLDVEASIRGQGSARGVYRSSFERYMRENDIATVRFLPLSYPGGVDSNVPALMEKDYKIDFDRLRAEGLPPADATLLREADGSNKQFAYPKKNRDTILWTYRLENVSESSFAYKDYSHFEQTQKITLLSSNERNRIHTRYVAVFADWIAYGDKDKTPNFIQQHVPIDGAEVPGVMREQVSAAAPNSDPFSAPCVAQHDNWLAVGMDFNKDGEFLGYISRWCNFGARDDDMGIQMAVTADLHDRCTDFRQVYRYDGINSLYDTTNKAWTNKVWKGAVNADGESARILSGGNPWQMINRNTSRQPYGSLLLSGTDLDSPQTLRNYTFRNTTDGLPYSCRASWLGGTPVDAARRCNALLLIKHDAPFVTAMNGVRDLDVAEGKINSIFATSFRQASVGLPALDSDSDITVVRTPKDSGHLDRKPPKVYSLNPALCEDRDKCIAAELDNFTVGQRNGTLSDYNNDGLPDEPDEDQNGAADPIIARGFYSAEVKFFAFADDNHMPLRRVMVDWGEEGVRPTNVDKRGLYKNRKPVCGGSNLGGFADVGLCVFANIPTGLTCSVDQECPGAQRCVEPGTVNQPTTLQGGALGDPFKTIQFGNTPRACIEDYFIFVHQYSCGDSNRGTSNAVLVRDLKNHPKAGDGIENIIRSRYGLGDDDFVCVFEPRVQVQDNWGWCNGECTEQYNGGAPVAGAPQQNGCYAEYPTDVAGSPDDQCNQFDTPALNPWSTYRGAIIVVPEP